jgi:hypothetical protein
MANTDRGTVGIGCNWIVIRSADTSGSTLMICDMADLVYRHYVEHPFSEVSLHFIGLKVLPAVIMNITIFCDISLCSPLKFNRRFGVIYCLALLANCFHAGFSLCLFFDPEDDGNILLRNDG